jgi:phosphatidylglycerol lysyltransferase
MPDFPFVSAHRLAALRTWVIRIAPFLLIVIAGFVLWRALHGLSPAQILAAIGRWSGGRIAMALGLVACGYGLLATNEQFALRWAGANVRLRDGMLASFITYAFANNLGMGVLMGGALRAGVYTRHDVGLTQVAQLTFYGLVTFSMGAAALCGFSFLTAPGAAFTALNLSVDAGRTIGFLLAGAPCAYILACLVLRGSVSLFGRTIRLPNVGLALLQLAFGICDVAVNAAIVWTLLGTAAPRYATFLGGYLVSVVAGLASGVPGGVGVFESVMLTLLPGVDRASMTAALLGYRMFYYLTPLSVAALTLFWRRSHPGKL